MSKEGDGGEDVSQSKGDIGLELEEDIDDKSGGIANGPYNITVAREVGSRSRVPNIQVQSVKRVRGVAITSGATVNVGNNGLGGSAVGVKRHRGDLEEARSAKNAMCVELEDAGFVKMATTTMN